MPEACFLLFGGLLAATPSPKCGQDGRVTGPGAASLPPLSQDEPSHAARGHLSPRPSQHPARKPPPPLPPWHGHGGPARRGPRDGPGRAAPSHCTTFFWNDLTVGFPASARLSENRCPNSMATPRQWCRGRADALRSAALVWTLRAGSLPTPRDLCWAPPGCQSDAAVPASCDGEGVSSASCCTRSACVPVWAG